MLLYVSSTNSTIKTSRDLKKDIIECSDEPLDCKQISADRISNTTCSCIGGTFYYSDDGQLKCVMGSGLFARCSSHFEYFSNSVQAISVLKYAATEFNSADEFSYSINTGVTCSKLEITDVMSLDDNMQWAKMDNDFKITYAPVINAFYLRWKDSQNVAATKYVGNLLKFSLTCTESSGAKLPSCLLGKITGDKEFNGENVKNNVCGQKTTTVVPKTTTITTTESPAVITLSSQATTSVTKLPVKQKQGETMSLTIIVGIACSIVFVIFLIILFCCVWRKRKQNKSSINKENSKYLTEEEMDTEQVYAVPTGPQDMDNPSYLTQLNSQMKNIPRRPQQTEYASAYENTQKRSQPKNDIHKKKEGSLYNNISPFSKNYYETPDQRFSLLTETPVTTPCTEYAELSPDHDPFETYVQMDDNSGIRDAYVPMDSL